MLVMKSLIFFILFQVAYASTYTMDGKKFEFPIAKNWLSKKSLKNQKIPLVFFEPNVNQNRIVLSAYRSGFKFPLEKIEVFDKTFKKSRKSFLKKISAKSTQELTYQLDKKRKTVRYSVGFKTDATAFMEYGTFQDCAGVGYNFKAMVPKGRKLSSEITEFLSDGDICPIK